MKHSFFGGVTPDAHKNITRRKPVALLDYAPEEVILPLCGYEDDPVTPVVQPGEQVLLGQLVARGEGLSAHVHASVSGTVTAIEQRPHPTRGRVLSLVIRSDGKDQPAQAQEPNVPLNETDLPTLLERTRLAGIVGMGGGGYPTAEKLRRAAGRIDTLIINAAECEPYVTADHRLLLEHIDTILRTARMLSRCLQAGRVVLVTEGDKLNAVEALERRLRKSSGKVELCTIRTRYPLGAERQIIQTVTGREIPLNGTPEDVKCLVLNIATVHAIHRALEHSAPLTHRIVTVTGGAVSRPRNLLVPIGTPLECLLKSSGGLRDKPRLMVTGGPMTGRPVEDLAAPVLKTTNALLCLSDMEQRVDGRETVCIRCGKCVAACPMHLVPTLIRQTVRRGELQRLAKLHPEDCLQCGCCSYICPAQIPLLELVAQGQEMLKQGGEQ